MLQSPLLHRQRYPDMYQVVLGKVSTLSAGQLPDALIAQAPQGVRRASWLAGRVLLSRALATTGDGVWRTG